MTFTYHTPVLVDAVVRLLDPKPGRICVDGTLGGGGHAYALAERLQPGGTLIVMDRDPKALSTAVDQLREFSVAIIPVHENFRNIDKVLDQLGISKVHAILLDLGVSSHQLDIGERGFSFRADAPLDMRMDPTQGETAAERLARAEERELSTLLWEYGEERWAARIAQKIVEQRKIEPIETTGQLARLVSGAIPIQAQPQNIHPATRTFQALRIAINDELGALSDALKRGIPRLAVGGRFGVIAYHSLEDRVVKQEFLQWAGRCQCPPGLPECRCGAVRRISILTRKPVTPDEAEISRNPRSRSAKLRVAEKIVEN